MNKTIIKSNNKKYFIKYIETFNLILNNNLIDHLYTSNINYVVGEF